MRVEHYLWEFWHSSKILLCDDSNIAAFWWIVPKLGTQWYLQHFALHWRQCSPIVLEFAKRWRRVLSVFARIVPKPCWIGLSLGPLDTSSWCRNFCARYYELHKTCKNAKTRQWRLFNFHIEISAHPANFLGNAAWRYLKRKFGGMERTSFPPKPSSTTLRSFLACSGVKFPCANISTCILPKRSGKNTLKASGVKLSFKAASKCSSFVHTFSEIRFWSLYEAWEWGCSISKFYRIKESVINVLFEFITINNNW